MLLRGLDLAMKYKDKEVFSGVSFDLSQGEIVGLIGINGAGKTTLMRMIAGELEATKGALSYSRNDCKVGYLPQSMLLQSEADESEFYKHAGQLGVDIKSNWRSGGEQTKESLAKVFSMDYDLILLDEPTNHLDDAGVEWLVEKIVNHRATFVIISHDRYFLDQVATSIYAFEASGFTTYYGNYSSYKEEYQQRIASQMHDYNEHRKEIKQIEAEIRRLKSWSDKAHGASTAKQKAGKGKKEYFRMKAKKRDKQIKSKVKQLEKKMTSHDGPPTTQREMVFAIFDKGDKRVKKLAEVREVAIGYDTNHVIANADFTWFNGENIIVVGANGCGKTTLIKTILGEIDPLAGEIYVTPNAKIGYLSQDRMTLNEGLSVIEQFDIESYQEKGQIIEALDNLGIHYEMTQQRVDTLSYGERLKVNLLLLMTQGCDGLILDEPTNHLDLLSREELESVLLQFPGGILAISHDQYFINAIGNSSLVFSNGEAKKYQGNYEDYQAHTESSKSKDSSDILLLEHELSLLTSRMSDLDANSKEYERLLIKYHELRMKLSSY